MNKRKRLVVGFCGLAGSGKNEAAMAVQGRPCWLSAAFADQIKIIARDEFGWNGVKDKKGRELLQDLGMLGRKFNELIWIQCLSRTIASFPDFNFTVTDVRFENEAEFIRNDLNGIIIRIIRPGQAMEKFHNHITESGQWKVTADYTIINSGSIPDLYNSVMSIIKPLEL